jgi:hypothetical protein
MSTTSPSSSTAPPALASPEKGDYLSKDDIFNNISKDKKPNKASDPKYKTVNAAADVSILRVEDKYEIGVQIGKYVHILNGNADLSLFF